MNTNELIGLLSFLPISFMLIIIDENKLMLDMFCCLTPDYDSLRLCACN